MPPTLQTQPSTGPSTITEWPCGPEPVNGVFVALLPLQAPHSSLVQPAPLTGASAMGGTDSRAGLLPSLAFLLTTGSVTAAPSEATGCSPALSSQNQEGRMRQSPHHLVSINIPSNLWLQGLPGTNRETEAWAEQRGSGPALARDMQFSGVQAHGSHHICQEIWDSPYRLLALNCSPSRAATKPVCPGRGPPDALLLAGWGLQS